MVWWLGLGEGETVDGFLIKREIEGLLKRAIWDGEREDKGGEERGKIGQERSGRKRDGEKSASTERG